MMAYPQSRLYEEIAFLAYYLHWGVDDLLELEHQDRQRWCEEVSKINKRLSPETTTRRRSIESI
jgi:hypothetical protein